MIFFFSLALIVKPRVHSQPSPTAPVWLSHRKLGFLYSLSLSFSMYNYSMRPSRLSSLCMWLCVSPICLLPFCFLFCVCLPWSFCLFVSVSLLLFSSNKHTTLPVSLSQPADWFSRRGSAGLHKHMALNLPSCVCWNGISFSMLFMFV